MSLKVKAMSDKQVQDLWRSLDDFKQSVDERLRGIEKSVSGLAADNAKYARAICYAKLAGVFVAGIGVGTGLLSLADLRLFI